MKGFKILIADDEVLQRETLSGFLKKQGFEIIQAADGAEALEFIRKESIDLVLTDLRMPKMDGLELLSEIQQINPDIQVVVMTAHGTIDTAVNAMHNGAYTYVTKPIDLSSLQLHLEKALEHKLLLSENRQLKASIGEFKDQNIIAVSSEMREVLGMVARAAPSQASILILGESGTGKELIAKAIHSASSRSKNQFVAVNISAIPETMLESELFGHVKGSFTGALANHTGHFERANGGTLFIDEIGDLPLQAQVKLLRVLQEGLILPLGGEKERKIDVRVVAATNRDIQQAMNVGSFREDLFYRLNVVRITIPPLRDRKSDIPPLIDHFVNKYTSLNNKQVNGVERDTLDMMMKYHWPGNVRELENAIESSVVLTRGDVLTAKDLPDSITIMTERNIGVELFDGGNPDLTLPEKLELMEKKEIKRILDETGGNRSETARRLGMSEKNIRDRIKKWDIN